MNARQSSDERLEQHIAQVAKQVEGLTLMGKPEEARKAAAKVAALIAMRSPEQIARMAK